MLNILTIAFLFLSFIFLGLGFVFITQKPDTSQTDTSMYRNGNIYERVNVTSDQRESGEHAKILGKSRGDYADSSNLRGTVSMPSFATGSFMNDDDTETSNLTYGYSSEEETSRLAQVGNSSTLFRTSPLEQSSELGTERLDQSSELGTERLDVEEESTENLPIEETGRLERTKTFDPYNRPQMTNAPIDAKTGRLVRLDNGGNEETGRLVREEEATGRLERYEEKTDRLDRFEESTDRLSRTVEEETGRLVRNEEETGRLIRNEEETGRLIREEEETGRLIRDKKEETDRLNRNNNTQTNIPNTSFQEEAPSTELIQKEEKPSKKQISLDITSKSKPEITLGDQLKEESQPQKSKKKNKKKKSENQGQNKAPVTLDMSQAQDIPINEDGTPSYDDFLSLFENI